MAASDPELIETFNRLQDENYHKLIRATSIFEAANSIERIGLAPGITFESQDVAGVDYFLSTSKLVIYSMHFTIINWVIPLEK